MASLGEALAWESGDARGLREASTREPRREAEVLIGGRSTQEPRREPGEEDGVKEALRVATDMTSETRMLWWSKLGWL